jgi:hypothetical protein
MMLKNGPFARLMADAMVLPVFDGGNQGVRRRQIQNIFQADGYEPWAATLEQPLNLRKNGDLQTTNDDAGKEVGMNGALMLGH